MKKNKFNSVFVPIMMLLLVVSSCSFVDYADSGTLIVDGNQAVGLLNKGYILVDAQKASSYAKEHIETAVNIERKAIMIKNPVANSLAGAEIIAKAAGNAGLNETSDIVIYDDNKNMDSSRLYWTLKIWGHKGDIVIVSGGLYTLIDAGLNVAKTATVVSPVTYNTGSLDSSMIASKEDILTMIDDPTDNFVLIDVRNDEEYHAGTIPGSIHINHEKNLFVNDDKGSTFRPVSHNRILYKELGITPDSDIVMYCKSSVRASNTYAVLYNAGYRNIRVYDGAWLEWSKEKLPVFKPDFTVETTTSSEDNS